MPLLEQVLEKYPQQVKVVFKNLPLRQHRFAVEAAKAALAAGKQGKFWEFHDRLFAQGPELSEEKIETIARELNLDLERLKKDRQAPEIEEIIRTDVEDAGKARVRGTPAVFVNGRLLNERSLSGFEARIKKELKEGKAPSTSSK